jgi:uncharacterized membrane protein
VAGENMSPTLKALIVINLILILFSWFTFFYYYPKLPSKVPMHFDWKGNVDTWGEKTLSLALLPALQTVLFIVFLIVSKFPKTFNFPGKEKVDSIPVDKRRVVYTLLKEFLFFVCFFENLIFLYLVRIICLKGMGEPVNFNPIYLFSLVLGIFLVLIYYLRKVNFTIKSLLRSPTYIK